jgi:hypothetical protein
METASQRDDIFKGGIQKGTVATDIHAKSLDSTLKELREEIYKEISHLGYTYSKSLDKSLLKSKGIEIGFVPDGGIWYKNGNVVGIFEAKKQGRGGNAIERWSKNYSISKYLFGNIRYVTFGSREGFDEDSYCTRFAKTFLMMEDNNKKTNILYKYGQSWIISPVGFTREEIKQYMINVITESGLE